MVLGIGSMMLSSFSSGPMPLWLFWLQWASILSCEHLPSAPPIDRRSFATRWSTASFTIREMTPVWIFPAYPLLIIGPHAGVLSIALSQKKAFSIIVGGFTLQGIGFMVSLMIYSAFIYRLMTQKLPQEATRPGMFVSVGPCGVSNILESFRPSGRTAMLDFCLKALDVVFGGRAQPSFASCVCS